MNDFSPACLTSSILTYKPLYGDHLIWSGWFSTWHGFLIDFKNPNDCVFIVAGLPILLANRDGTGKSIKRLNLDDIRNSKGGKFAIIRHNHENSLPTWYL